MSRRQNEDTNPTQKKTFIALHVDMFCDNAEVKVIIRKMAFQWKSERNQMFFEGVRGVEVSQKSTALRSRKSIKEQRKHGKYTHNM